MKVELHFNYLISQPIDKKVSIPQYSGNDNVVLKLDATTVEDAIKEMQDVIDSIKRGLIELNEK